MDVKSYGMTFKMVGEKSVNQKFHIQQNIPPTNMRKLRHSQKIKANLLPAQTTQYEMLKGILQAKIQTTE